MSEQEENYDLQDADKEFAYEAMMHGGKKTNVYRHKQLCGKCGNDTFYIYDYDAACVCSEGYTTQECTKCGYKY